MFRGSWTLSSYTWFSIVHSLSMKLELSWNFLLTPLYFLSIFEYLCQNLPAFFLNIFLLKLQSYFFFLSSNGVVGNGFLVYDNGVTAEVVEKFVEISKQKENGARLKLGILILVYLIKQIYFCFILNKYFFCKMLIKIIFTKLC